jgi:hypothetical protein
MRRREIDPEEDASSSRGGVRLLTRRHGIDHEEA